MPKTGVLTDVGISRRDFVTIFVLLFNALTWYYMALVLVDSLANNLNSPNSLSSVYYVSIILAGLVGAALESRVGKIRLIYTWMLIGFASSLLPILMGGTIQDFAIVLPVLWGVSFGLGMPSALSYFADYTSVENRGRIAGILFLVSNFSVIPIALMFRIFNLGLVMVSIFSGAWRVWGLVVVYLLKTKEKTDSKMQKDVSFVSIFENRNFILFAVPWLLFSLVNGLEEPIVRSSLGTDFASLVYMMEPIIGGTIGLVAGLIADTTGRRRVVITGFVALGLAYAILGVAPQENITRYLFVAIDGVAAGILMVLFFFVIWGDLVPRGTSIKYYAIGGVIHFTTYVVRQVSAPYVAQMPPTAAFSLAALFLFLAVIPLMYAPETLPEKKI